MIKIQSTRNQGRCLGWGVGAHPPPPPLPEHRMVVTFFSVFVVVIIIIVIIINRKIKTKISRILTENDHFL